MKRYPRFGDFNSIAGGAYSGAADIGKGFAYFNGVIFVIIAILLIIFGFIQGGQPDIYTNQVNFTVTEITSNKIGSDSNKKPIYDYTLVGTVDGCGADLVNVHSYPDKVNIGQKLTNIYMRPNCVGPEGVKNPVSNKTTSRWMIGIGFALILFTIINIYFVNKFKGVAALQGVGNIFSLFRFK